ncbi:MAG: cupin domain-containing protein [Cytophagaceae bacterium]|jgi:mannose-6-phosphate isomerase-like protein (cupin superfamily)|nr:cupin domain-containing protein [Cytophagaceae bacterium]
MQDRQLIESGILELYVLGLLSDEESLWLASQAADSPAVQSQLQELQDTLEQWITGYSKPLHPVSKASLMATIDFKSRIQQGERPKPFPPLHKNIHIQQLEPWLELPENQLPEPSEEVVARILAYDGITSTMLVWIKKNTPQEVHTHELESFFIVEGTCEIWVENQATSLQAGDFFEIPLHRMHYVHVTSSIPCKVILQRKKIA